MKTLVERIRNRELAIKNNGTFEELRKAVRHCFPNSILDPHGNCKFYFAEKNDLNSWDGYGETDLPTVSVKEVLAEIEGESKESPSSHTGVFTEKYAKKISDSMMEEARKDLKKHDQDIDVLIKETKVIYLNEEDRPKIEEPLSFTEWMHKTWYVKVQDLTNYTIDCEHQIYIEYRNNFNPNDNPIEFEDLECNPCDYDFVEYRGDGTFFCWNKGWSQNNITIHEGNLNNGKVK